MHKKQPLSQQDAIRTQSGRTMLEMLAVLAIIGLLSVMGIIGLSYAFRQYRENETVSEFIKTVVSARTDFLKKWYLEQENNVDADGAWVTRVVPIQRVMSSVDFNADRTADVCSDLCQKNPNPLCNTICTESFSTRIGTDVFVQVESPNRFVVSMRGFSNDPKQRAEGLSVCQKLLSVQLTQLCTFNPAALRSTHDCHDDGDAERLAISPCSKMEGAALYACEARHQQTVQNVCESVVAGDKYLAFVFGFGEGTNVKKCEEDNDCDRYESVEDGTVCQCSALKECTCWQEYCPMGITYLDIIFENGIYPELRDVPRTKTDGPDCCHITEGDKVFYHDTPMGKELDCCPVATQGKTFKRIRTSTDTYINKDGESETIWYGECYTATACNTDTDCPKNFFGQKQCCDTEANECRACIIGDPCLEDADCSGILCCDKATGTCVDCGKTNCKSDSDCGQEGMCCNTVTGTCNPCGCSDGLKPCFAGKSFPCCTSYEECWTDMEQCCPADRRCVDQCCGAEDELCKKYDKDNIKGLGKCCPEDVDVNAEQDQCCPADKPTFVEMEKPRKEIGMCCPKGVTSIDRLTEKCCPTGEIFSWTNGNPETENGRCCPVGGHTYMHTETDSNGKIIKYLDTYTGECCTANEKYYSASFVPPNSTDRLAYGKCCPVTMVDSDTQQSRPALFSTNIPRYYINGQLYGDCCPDTQPYSILTGFVAGKEVVLKGGCCSTTWQQLVWEDENGKEQVEYKCCPKGEILILDCEGNAVCRKRCLDDKRKDCSSSEMGEKCCLCSECCPGMKPCVKNGKPDCCDPEVGE